MKVGQEIKRRARKIENETKGPHPMPARWRPKEESTKGRVSVIEGKIIPKDLLKTAKIYYLREVKEYTWGQIEKDCECSRSLAVGRYKKFVKALKQTAEEYLKRFLK